MLSSDDAQHNTSARLRQLMARGFQLMPPVRDTAGELEALIYVRPKGDIIDVVELIAEDDVRAARVPRRGEISTEGFTDKWEAVRKQ